MMSKLLKVNGRLKRYILFASIVIFVMTLLFSRFYNLDVTARFIWDESSDLVNMHQIYVEKNLTLVGPISEDGEKVFGSLTYYMLLPFAILGNFDPVSTAYGAAFWGVLTACMILILSLVVNKKLLVPTALLVLFWFPFFETSRWAWNPNLVPFWAATAVLLYLRKTKPSLFFAGITLGLTVHHHYLAFFSVAMFALLVLIENIRKQKWVEAALFVGGVVLSLLPFVVFDLLHPPGLFLTRLLYFNHLQSGGGLTAMPANLIKNFEALAFYFAERTILSYIVVFLVSLLLILDIKTRSRSLMWAAVWMFQVILLVFITPFYVHYLIPCLVFFVVWLIWPRNKMATRIGLVLVGVLIVSGFLSIIPRLWFTDWQNNIKATRHTRDVIIEEINNKKLQNVNIVVVSSPDPNTYGRRYRDLLLLKDIKILDRYQYDITDWLFVISTSEEGAVREDPAFELNRFRSGTLMNQWIIPDSPWKMYLFNRNGH